MTSAVILSAILLGLWTGIGFLHPVGTFGRYIAPYTLAGTISLLLPLLASVIVSVTVPD